MKRIIAILLSLALLLACAAGLAEEADNKQIFGTIRVNGEFTLKGVLPEGYQIVPFERSDDAILSNIVAKDPARPVMALSIAYDETYSDVQTLDDLDDDGLTILEKTFTDTDPLANITYDETAHGTRLMVCRTLSDTYDYLTILAIYKGYFVEFAMMPGDEAAEQKLTDQEIAACNQFLSELDFVEGIEVPELVTRGKSFTATIDAFDAAARTLDVTLLTPYEMTEWQTISINEGDTIRIGTEDVEIATLSYDGDNAVINDQYYLAKNEDGLYNPYDFDYPLMQEAKKLTVTVPDSLVFEEGIDAETGEPLDEVKTLTADDLFTALAAEEGVGFDAQNVTLTFDEDDQPKTVTRFYVPWQ